MLLKCLIFLLLPYSVYSQQTACSFRFQGILSAGLAAGQSTTKPLVQIGGGVNFKRFYTGVGIGVDAYRFQSIPIFADWRFNVGKMKTAFLYSNAGYNIPFDNETEEGFFGTWWVSEFTDKFTGGFYMDAGIGYRIPIKGWHRLLVSAGYSYKRINNIVKYRFPCPGEPCMEESYRYQYNLGRVVAKVSWEFARPGK